MYPCGLLVELTFENRGLCLLSSPPAVQLIVHWRFLSIEKECRRIKELKGESNHGDVQICLLFRNCERLTGGSARLMPILARRYSRGIEYLEGQ